jgi:hypothetical protein
MQFIVRAPANAEIACSDESLTCAGGRWKAAPRLRLRSDAIGRGGESAPTVISARFPALSARLRAEIV